MKLVLFILLSAYLPTVYGRLHPHFAAFLKRVYGVKMSNQIQRLEFLSNGIGAFGGGPSKKGKRPVIFVHGLRNTAGYLNHQFDDFEKAGWPRGRLYATTYGFGHEGENYGMSETAKCQHIKQIRTLIQAVIKYQASDVDVIAYSFGSPLARKAILGGHCVDTKEALGPSIAGRINTFLSVAGANQGSNLCNLPFGGICNEHNGLHCNSDFLRDINKGPVGKHVYSMASSSDIVVGQTNSCGQRIAEFPGAKIYMMNDLSHEDMIFNTIPRQIEIIKDHYKKSKKL